MRLPVRHVVELVRPNRAIRFGSGQALGQAFGVFHVVVRVPVWNGRNLHQLRPAELDHVLLFLALGFGNHDDRPKPHRGTHKREPDAGVAGRTLNDRASGLQRAPRDRVANDVQRGTVLDGLARIQELGLSENLAACGIGRTVQPDQRRVSYGFGKIAANGHRHSLVSRTRPSSAERRIQSGRRIFHASGS